VAKLKKRSRLILFRKYSSNIKFVMMALCVVVVTLFLPKQARFKFEYEKGKLWMNKDLISPYTFAIKKTNAEIEKDQSDVLKSINPIYQNDIRISEKQQDAFASDFEIQWKSSGQDLKEKQNYKITGKQILEEIYKRGIISLNKKFQRYAANYNFSLVTNNVSIDMNTLDVFTLETAMKYAQDRIAHLSSIDNKTWLLKLLSDHFQANYVYDERLSDKLETNALNNISPTRGIVQKGELIVAEGNTVTPDIYQKLESLRSVYEEDARIVGDRRLAFIGQFLLVGIAVVLLMTFLFLFRKDIRICRRTAGTRVVHHSTFKSDTAGFAKSRHSSGPGRLL